MCYKEAVEMVKHEIKKNKSNAEEYYRRGYSYAADFYNELACAFQMVLEKAESKRDVAAIGTVLKDVDRNGLQ